MVGYGKVGGYDQSQGQEQSQQQSSSYPEVDDAVDSAKFKTL